MVQAPRKINQGGNASSVSFLRLKGSGPAPILFVAVTAGALCIALAVAYVAITTFFVQDSLYDNVPSKAGCEDIPSEEVIEAAIDEFPTIGDADAISVEQCEGAILEIQYGSTSTRKELEEYLNENGKYDRSTGWWWHSVPVSLRNV